MSALPTVCPQSPTPWEQLKLKLLTTTSCILCVRVLFALEAIHMVLIALLLCDLQLSVHSSHVVASSYSEWVEINMAFTVWIVALLSGGVCAIKAAWTKNVAAARRTLVCWAVATSMHTWYMLVGMQLVQRQLVSPETPIEEHWTSWSTLTLHVVTDVVTMVFMVLFIAVLHAHEKEENGAADASEVLRLLSPKHEANEAVAGQV